MRYRCKICSYEGEEQLSRLLIGYSINAGQTHSRVGPFNSFRNQNMAFSPEHTEGGCVASLMVSNMVSNIYFFKYGPF